MSFSAKTMTVACVAFLLPVGIAMSLNWDAIQSQLIAPPITAETAEGRVLCFTAPS
jgi:hypothetical protein